jgi:regulatory protein
VNDPPAPELPAPDRASLHEAALRHLARYATTRANLLRVLDRRIARWARAVHATDDAIATARAAARAVVEALAAAGAVSDADFAAARARSLARAGRSRQAIGAHLAARGVDAATRAAALPDDAASELAAALLFLRRRRLGPYLRPGAVPPERTRVMAALARAGFPQHTARQALDMDPDTAEALITALKHG